MYLFNTITPEYICKNGRNRKNKLFLRIGYFNISFQLMKHNTK